MICCCCCWFFSNKFARQSYDASSFCDVDVSSIIISLCLCPVQALAIYIRYISVSFKFVSGASVMTDQCVNIEEFKVINEIIEWKHSLITSSLH